MIINRELNADVVTAARQRIINIFDTYAKVYMSFSGGKDSLTLAHLTTELYTHGKIDIKKLYMVFIDEEAIFPCVEKTVMDWRDYTLSLGAASFDWFALEVRHHSCLNSLENDESFICWDRFKRGKWIRDPPPFAIRSHPLLRPRVDTYQQFLRRVNDGINMVGVRVFESIQRRNNFENHLKSKTISLRKYNLIQPIYDWHDSDVWLYLHEHKIQIPDAYLYMWQIGRRKNHLRISQFFSVDTISTLSEMTQYYPNLMSQVCKREPNAYIVALYYDSEMFRRKTSRRKKLEATGDTNYEAKVLNMLSNIPENFRSKYSQQIAIKYRNRVMRCKYAITPDHWRDLYESLLAGDPKLRNLRAIEHRVRMQYARLAYPD